MDARSIAIRLTFALLLLFEVFGASIHSIKKEDKIPFNLRIGGSLVSFVGGSSNSLTRESTEKIKRNVIVKKNVSSKSIEIEHTRPVNNLECNLDSELLDEISQYRGIVHQIIDFVVNGDFKGKTFDKLTQLTDTFGSRMTGSQSLESSIDWMLKNFNDQKMDNVYTEPVQAPHWVRNNESLFMMQPRLQKLHLLGLGSSVSTPPEGIVAEVIVFESFEELERNQDKVKNKVVVFNQAWDTYGGSVPYRVHGASRAAKYGALATLIRSIAPFSINSPHTGWQSYNDAFNKIPSACITIEDAQMLYRMQNRGETIMVNLTMGAQNLPDVTTRNTIAEIMGYEKPEEIVVVSAHLDSWDVGNGAMDDGGGVMISWGATTILKRMGLRPRRTIQTVLFTGEEQGLHGGQAYFKKHSDKADKYQLILESDIGTFNPKGLSFSGNNESQCIMKEILSLLEPINATQLSTPTRGAPDIQFWEKVGVPTGSVLNDESSYFWFHHSEGDTVEVEDSPTLDRCAALWTAVSFVAADISINFPRD